jgi:hypothetical protein
MAAQPPAYLGIVGEGSSRRAPEVVTDIPSKNFTGVGGEVAQTMYTHVSKYKKDKIKGRRKKKKRISKGALFPPLAHWLWFACGVSPCVHTLAALSVLGVMP